MYAPEGVANPRTPNVGPACFRSERGDEVRPAPKTNWEVITGKRTRLERCTTREMIRALAVAVFREGIIGLGSRKSLLRSVRVEAPVLGQVIEYQRVRRPGCRLPKSNLLLGFYCARTATFVLPSEDSHSLYAPILTPSLLDICVHRLELTHSTNTLTSTSSYSSLLPCVYSLLITSFVQTMAVHRYNILYVQPIFMSYLYN
jgi:hypothetical protein